MNFREQLDKARHGPRCRFGGDDTQSSTNTTSNYDNRSISTTNNSNYDLSNHSVTNNDLSNNSVTTNSNNSITDSYNTTNISTSSSSTDIRDSYNTTGSYNTTTSNLWDSSTKITNNTTTDNGAVAAAIQFASSTADKVLAASNDQAAHAYDFADGIFDSALDFANQNDGRALSAFDRAATIQKDALTQVQNAYADAKGTTQSQQKIMIAVLVVAGIAVLVAKARG